MMKQKGVVNLTSLVRSFIYSATIFSVLYILILHQFSYSKEVYFLLAFIGGLLIFEESLFTIFHSNNYKKKELSYFTHGFNHTIYPQFFYVGLVVYSYLQNDYFLSFGLAVLSFFVYFLYFHLLPKHIHDDHIDGVESEKSSAKVDFIIYVFKFLSYFSVHLGLFELLRLGYISEWELLITNFAVNFIYLLAHLNRKHEVGGINLFMSLMFSLITSFFIFKLRVPSTDYSASISTLVFYLSSGIFYHKVDGNFNYKVFLEYASIAVLLSVFLFSS